MQKGIAQVYLLIVLLVALVLIATKFFYANITSGGVVGVSTYKNLFGQEFVCSVSPPSIASDSCSKYLCILNGCFTINPTKITTSIPSITPTKTADETANWKTYTSSEYNPFFSDETIKKYNQTKQPDGYTNDENTKYIKFSIKYPANWQQGYFDDPVGGSEGKNSFIFSNGDYKITISKGYAPGGNSCDQKILKEILTQTSGFNLSRVKVFDSKTGTFELCERGGSNTRIGKIIYITPQNYDTKILDEMDQIISTLKIIN